MTKVLIRPSPKTSRFGAAAALAASVLLSVPVTVRAQSSLPSTTCDAAVSYTDLHFPAGMPLEDGTKAFTYGAEMPFVTGGGASITINVNLRFPPGEDATIKLSALDESCGGTSSSGTVFSYTFGALTATRNTITYDVPTGEVGFNGEIQQGSPLGTPRYLFVDVWDGALPAVFAAHSYVIDLQNPMNPRP
jgi:hypothetical protein